LLGTIAEHYTAATGAEEIAIWRAAHDGSLDPLVQAIRDCPFLSRRAALVKVLAGGVPERDELPARLLHDPQLGPVVLLAQKQDRKPEEVSPAQAAWLMAGSLLELLEIGGPDAVREQLEELPSSQREDVVRAVRDSGHPARGTLEDFRVLVAEPILGGPVPAAGRPERSLAPSPSGETPRSLTPQRAPRAQVTAARRMIGLSLTVTFHGRGRSRRSRTRPVLVRLVRRADGAAIGGRHRR